MRQIARKIANELSPRGKKVSFLFIDSSRIAAARWGEAEQKLRFVFKMETNRNQKIIILIDDIDCLMMKRGLQIAQEWHYSINSIIFHELDLLDPSQKIILATTNQKDLIDDALRSRLYYYQVPEYSIEDLLWITERSIMKFPAEIRKRLMDVMKNYFDNESKNNKALNMRDVQHALIQNYIKFLVE